MRFLVIFAALVLSASAHAQTIHACAKNRGGALRIVSSPADCTSRETPISWNVQGAPGADAEVLHVFDRNGVDLGIYSHGESDSGVFEIYLPEHEITFAVLAGSGDFVESGTLSWLFADVNCADGTFSTITGRLLQDNANTDVFVVTSTEVVQIAPVALSNSPFPEIGDDCSIISHIRLRYVVPATQVDPATDLGLSFPLPGPLFVAPAP